MSNIIKAMPKAIAKTAKAAGGLALINQAVAPFAPALEICARHRSQWEACIGSIGLAGVPFKVAEARQIHNRFLGAVVEIDSAHVAFTAMWQTIDQASALRMLHVLFTTLGRKRTDDESAVLLAAAAAMFDPVNDVLGSVTGVKPIRRHPLILALAVKRLIDTAKFTSVAELREAMAYIENSIGNKRWHLEYMMEKIERADEMLFEQDRATWEANHRRCSVAVNRTMLSELETNEENPFEDDDGEQYPGSPRWQALDEILKAKASKSREAACAMKPAKRASRREDTTND